MSAGASGLLFVPLGIFALAGLSLWAVSRRKPSPLLLRLGAIFLASWAVLVTTALVWVIARGGFPGITSLVENPGLLFEPASAWVWLFGALGALLVFGAAFLLNQSVGRGFLRLLDPSPVPWPAGLPAPEGSAQLLAFDSADREAFSFTLLRFSAHERLGFYREEVILFSRGLWAELTPRERTAAVAHELGHVRGFDGRYLTFVRTLSRLVLWDPLVAYVSSGLTRREELRADDDAVQMTGDPEALARALFKTRPVARPDSDEPDRARRRGRAPAPVQVRERIARLSAMAEARRSLECDYEARPA